MVLTKVRHSRAVMHFVLLLQRPPERRQPQKTPRHCSPRQKLAWRYSFSGGVRGTPKTGVMSDTTLGPPQVRLGQVPASMSFRLITWRKWASFQAPVPTKVGSWRRG
ncbi:MAG: hypothetical protein AMS22_05470 [Thiotrichales bacterium SG8_50]|nr:MAG: hypothetical protein AMS22_05470 [Thiotrichales bacterium SG8_50]